MKIEDLDMSPAVQEGLAVAQRTFGLTSEQLVVFALEAFLKDRGLLAQEERVVLPQQRETRGRAEMAFAREEGR